MAATVATYYYYGAGPSSEVATNVRFKLADNNTQDTNNPCVVPSNGGPYYSAWKTVTLYCTGTAPDNDIESIKLYTDGTLGWTGATVSVGNEVTDNYDQATGSGDSWDEMTNHLEITAKTDLFSYTSGSPKTIAEAAGWATPGMNEPITGYVVLQLELDNTAVGGSQAAETATWQYDET